MTTVPATGDLGVSLGGLFKRFRWRILGTMLLVVLESLSMLMFPLALGIAVDGLARRSFAGVWGLGGLCAAAAIVGAARRFYDTRVYAHVNARAMEQVVEQERRRGAPVSVVAARSGMATEIVDFFEDSFPGLVDGVIGFVGTLVVIWWLQPQVLVACLAATLMIVAIYAATSRATYAANCGFNDESERSVHVLSEGPRADVRAHFGQLRRWQIRVSDLETVNFSANWLVMIPVLLFAVVTSSQRPGTSQGEVLSVLVYVLGYVESVVTLPLFYQQSLRLGEISGRFTGMT